MSNPHNLQEKAAWAYEMARNTEHSDEIVKMFQILAAHQSRLARNAAGVTE